MGAGGVQPAAGGWRACWQFYDPHNSVSASSYSFIDYLGYGKAAISCIKYVPQAYMNWKRQSTVGWSIINIMLDFTGGSLSFTQQFIDAYNRQDGSVIWGQSNSNPHSLMQAAQHHAAQDTAVAMRALPTLLAVSKRELNAPVPLRVVVSIR